MKRNRLRVIINTGMFVPRMMTSIIRTSPDFIIIGAQRCGTTSLYNYLINHPYIIPAWSKEVHYFDNNYCKGKYYYKSYFPTKIFMRYKRKLCKKEIITGEASPYYIFHPHALKRIKKLLPNIKIIAMLRNPVDRAYSHYQHELRLGFENLSFEEAIARECLIIDDEISKMRKNENYYSLFHQHFSYLSRGKYIEQVKGWIDAFTEERVKIIKSENFYNNPSAVYESVLEFLNLPRHRIINYKKYNNAKYKNMDKETRLKLLKYFEPYNNKLFEYLGEDFGWNDELLV